MLACKSVRGIACAEEFGWKCACVKSTPSIKILKPTPRCLCVRVFVASLARTNACGNVCAINMGRQLARLLGDYLAAEAAQIDYLATQSRRGEL